MRRLCLLACAAALCAAPTAPALALAPPTNPHVTFDRYSLSIDGRRVFINSGEVHPFRMPSPRVARNP